MCKIENLCVSAREIIQHTKQLPVTNCAIVEIVELELPRAIIAVEDTVLEGNHKLVGYYYRRIIALLRDLYSRLVEKQALDIFNSETRG